MILRLDPWHALAAKRDGANRARNKGRVSLYATPLYHTRPLGTRCDRLQPVAEGRPRNECVRQEFDQHTGNESLCIVI